MSVANPNNQTIATNNNSVLARIEDLIGTHHSDANWDIDIDAAYSMAVALVVDTIPAEVLVKYTEDANKWTLATDDTDPEVYWSTRPVDGKKVLLLTRSDDDGVERNVKPVSIAEFSRAKDTNSMFYATELTPVWTIIPNQSGDGIARLNMFPAPEEHTVSNAQVGTLYLFPYPTAVPYSDSGSTRTYANTIEGIPNELIQAIVLQSAINALQSYLGWAVLDEEDQELTSLITAQMQTYKAELAIELSRYVEGKVE